MESKTSKELKSIDNKQLQSIAKRATSYAQKLII